MKRSSGILLSISSLPSKYGIGTFGKSAYEFVDFLKKSGQKYWQILPLGPTSYGDSPYSSFSTYAGNPYYIDLEILMDEGLLKKSELEAENWGTNPRYVDYGQIYSSRFKILELAKERDWAQVCGKVTKFVIQNPWVEDYALFMALKKHFNQVSWLEWPDKDIRLRKATAMEKYKLKLESDIEFFQYIQYKFFEQWTKLKKYVNDAGISIIGDVPIYVALDSSDVWSEPKYFCLDEENYPVEVSGVPPDYFSADGQLWGNPIYNWSVMKSDKYAWWLRRIAGATKMYDVIRIDHFRGFDEYWSVPAGSTTAKNGQWKKGPGMDLVGLLEKTFKDIEFIAEDLGAPSPTVKQLLKDSKWPGMKVLGFAFDSKEPSDYRPHTYYENCVCYTGTHDNATFLEWYETAPKEAAEFAYKYLGASEEIPIYWAAIRSGMSSVAKLFVAQIQDYLGLGKNHRINVPGTVSGNWQWRLCKEDLSDALADKIYENTAMFDRIVDNTAEVELNEAVEKKSISFVKRFIRMFSKTK